MTKINSSIITEIDYDKNELLLTVYFTKGNVYLYHDVPYEIISQMLEAESKGSFFTKNIAKKFKYEKIS